MTSIRIPRPWEIPERLATPESVFLDRRQLLASLGFGAVALALPFEACAGPQDPGSPAARAAAATPEKLLAPAVGDRYAALFPARRDPAYDLGGRPLTAEEIAARYNNFYKFTTDKDRVWKLAQGYPVVP